MRIEPASLVVVAHPLAPWNKAEKEVKDDLLDGIGPLPSGQFGASLHLSLCIGQSGNSTELVISPVIGETTGCDCRSDDVAHSLRYHVFSSWLDDDDGIHIDARVIIGPMKQSIYDRAAQDQLSRHLDLLLDHAADELDYAAEAKRDVEQISDCWSHHLPTAAELIELISESLRQTSSAGAASVPGRTAYRPSTDGRELAWRGITREEADFLQLDWAPDIYGCAHLDALGFSFSVWPDAQKGRPIVWLGTADGRLGHCRVDSDQGISGPNEAKLSLFRSARQLRMVSEAYDEAVRRADG